ncbi:MAG: calcium-transporting P-type ATPase, PMR1-type [Anaerolineales bacterium]
MNEDMQRTKTDTQEGKAWHAMPTEAVLKELKVSAEKGLESDQAASRLAEFGPNQLEEAPRPTFWQMLWDQLNNFVVMLLLVAALISGIIGVQEYSHSGDISEFVEVGAILLIVILNAVLGIVQEGKAEEALAALQKMAAPDAQVIRDGHRQTVPASQLVPGDIVLLEAGNFIPADVRLIESMNLKVEEAALTGESVPVQKVDDVVLPEDASLGDRKNSAFMSTLVSYGRGKGVVVGTGMKTQIGLIASMIQSVHTEETPLQKRLDQLGKTLGWAALIVCALVFGIGWIRGYEPLEMFIIAVSLAIAAVPEGLPAVVTISLALGMREMIRRNALIRRLASVETLGSATVICSDKTGTLTQNEMTVTQISVDGKDIYVTGSGYAPQGEFQIEGKPIDILEYPAATTALWVGALNNDALLEQQEDGTYKMIGDPTEGAIIVAAAKANKEYQELSEDYPRVQEITFDSVRKRMTTIHKVLDPHTDDFSPFKTDDLQKDWYVVAVKGAPDVMLELCEHYQTYNDQQAEMTEAVRERIRKANDEMARKALRVIAVAYKVVKEIPVELTPENVEKDLIFAGLIGMIDPPRAEVSDSLAVAAKAGIRTIMITGDYPQTARAIAEEIGLMKTDQQVITGAELSQMSDDTLREKIKSVNVFARVSPEHKMRIVDALQSHNEVVAMTGDGVNDAPAIKRADIGVAMGITGTDVAKETADMVLTDDNYTSIVSAINQGRIIYSNIRKFVFFLLSANVAEIMIIFLATLAGLPAPLTAIQLLWLNLVTDGAPALALAMEKGDPDIMEQKPRAKDEPIINKIMGIGITVQTFAQTSVVLLAFGLGLIWHLEEGAVLTGNPLLYILQHDWRGVDVQTAETMAFLTLAFAELFRAYTVRSERASIFQIGMFSNKYMQYAVALSIILLLLVVNVPFLQPIFNTHFLTGTEWIVVLVLGLLPAVAEEITKFFLRRSEK